MVYKANLIPIEDITGNQELIASDYINVRVLTEDDKHTFYGINKNAKFANILEAFCLYTSMNAANVFFKFDGEHIEENSTPLSLDLEDGDTIEVWIRINV